jgi:hypothetical protein
MTTRCTSLRGASASHQLPTAAARGSQSARCGGGGAQPVTGASTGARPERGQRFAAAAPLRASQLEVRPVQWLWPGRVPQGGITVLAGEPGLGKSLLSVWLASRLSRGELAGAPATSLFLTAEDSREHTVLPRLVAAGAELEQVVFPPASIRWAGKGSPASRRRQLPWRADSD